MKLAEEEVLGNLSVRGSLIPILEELYQDDHVLWFQLHASIIHSLFANSKCYDHPLRRHFLKTRKKVAGE